VSTLFQKVSVFTLSSLVILGSCFLEKSFISPAYAQSAQENLNAMVTRLKRANNIPETTVKSVQMMDSNDMNAATDGQQIMVTTRLWNTFKTDDQRAFVVAHELSHIMLGHVPKTQLRRVGLSLVNRLISNRTGGRGFENAGLALLDMKFSRGMEYQADDLGVQMMTKAGYSAQGAIEGFKILKANAGNAGPEFLQSHPLTESRVRSLAQKHGLSAS
jgi:predicted Zn-dependent protease